MGIMIRTPFLLAACSLVYGGSFLGCADGDPEGDALTKDQLVGMKADGLDPCLELGHETGCDLCAEEGWYDDERCDSNLINEGICRGPDPACPVPDAVIRFESEGDPVVEGVIRAGSLVEVDYAYQRLLYAAPECVRETPYGNIFEVQMGVKFNGDDSTDEYHLFVAGYSATSYYSVETDNTIDVPEGALEMALWFSCGGTHHNERYDSGDEGNYHFEVESEEHEPTDAVIHFGSEGAPVVEGDVSAGSSVEVEYDYARLLDRAPGCVRETPYGDIFEVQMGVKFNGDDSTDEYHLFVAGYSATSYYRVQTDNTIDVPEGAFEMALWFSCGGPFHNNEYDSNDGQNYIFPVE